MKSRPYDAKAKTPWEVSERARDLSLDNLPTVCYSRATKFERRIMNRNLLNPSLSYVKRAAQLDEKFNPPAFVVKQLTEFAFPIATDEQLHEIATKFEHKDFKTGEWVRYMAQAEISKRKGNKE